MFAKKAIFAIVTLWILSSLHNTMSAQTSPTLQQKIGQMIMVGFYGTNASDREVKALQREIGKGTVGGVIFFNYNIESPQQFKQLTHTFHATDQKLPIFLAVDQEGGRVQRLPASKGFQGFLPPHTVSQQKTPTQAQSYYEAMARELKSVGVNLNLAPIVDIHSSASPVIGGLSRSFSNDPTVIARYTEAFVNAHRKFGVLTCLKHFPGHGLAQKDSHLGLVDITNTYQQAERTPFQLLNQSGHADMVMTAHLMHKKIDSNYPSSLSPSLTQSWLRQEDHYDGIVITDDLMMGAIAQHFDLEEIVVQAILAGNDILLFSNNIASNPNESKSTHDTEMTLPQRITDIVVNAIQQGKIPQSRIDDSYRRIVRCKSQLRKMAA